MWGSNDFCPAVTSFQVQVIMQTQLNPLSQMMAWGDAEKPWWDIAFLLITLNITAGYERIFGLVTLWVHPHQVHYITPADAAYKLMLLEDSSANWVYAFTQLNEVLSHAPLSSMAHISTMTDGTPCTDAHGWLHWCRCICCYSIRT